MRVLLMFDLPTLSKKNQKDYRVFVSNLKKLGFYMLQESVYTKFCLDQRVVDNSINIVKSFSPSEGSVMLFSLTEKQFNNMTMIVGNSVNDVVSGDERFIEL